ncbi:MAG: EthD family reductase [Anaerolineae bacterium]
MVKLVALYRKPEDPQAFEHAYFETHLPLVKKVPGLQRVQVTRVTGAPRGEPELYMIAELYFPDKETMDRAMASPENQAAGKNLMGFARGLVTFLFAEEVESCNRSVV